jgi:leucyl-tRNA synthetase
MKRYNPKEIEPRWQQKWADSKIYEAQDNSTRPKKFVLEYFPYPSGAAMHVGHVRNYTIGDAISRYNRMQGFDVLHPMGWDAFGLPAENYAIKTGISPQEAVAKNVERFKEQLTQMGFGYDWSREVNSTDPGYYRWTQWFFLLLHKRGLAYQKESMQWWCPVDKTVLANEQVENGVCWRCGSNVEKKALKQWFFKITDYADRLEKDLDDVNWSHAIKSMQRNWIGRSKGAEVDFVVDGTHKKLQIFTTRPDTLYGATFMVIAPEHPLAHEIVTDDHKEHVGNYIKAAQAKSDIERQETDREKTGVFTGACAINPVNSAKVPIWVADYVLAGYGTGAIMAVPGHDQRDRDFALKFDLPIIDVVAPETGAPQENPEFRRSIVAIVHNPRNNTFLSINWGKQGGNLFVGGGREENEDVIETAKREVAEETGYTNLKLVGQTGVINHNYFAHSKNVARRIEANGILFELVDDTQQERALEDNEQGKFTVEWLSQADVEARVKDELHTTVYSLLVKGECYRGEGVMVNSGPYNGKPSSDVREQIVADLAGKGAGKERVNYKIRDWLISRQRYWGAPIPIIHCEKDGAVAVPDDQLPVVLPPMESYEPSGDGRSPLARVPEWVNTTCPTCGGPATRETDTMDGFACSSWYFLRYADPHNDQKAFDADKVARWLPVDDYIGGAEHAVMHLLYARFWTKVMQDEGLITFSEPFKTLRNHGMILAPDGNKMSKSKGNTIEPGILIEQGYGADAIRIMELFIGPWNQAANWSVEGMGGAFRFLQRIWNLGQEVVTTDAKGGPADAAEITKVVHRAIKRVSGDMEVLGFNTAIAALMEAVNDLYRLKKTIAIADAPETWRFAVETLLQLVAPFAPHMSDELWEQLGHDTSIHISAWPTYDERYLVSSTMTIVVQVNGKVRAQLEIASDATEEQVVAAAKAHEKITAYLAAAEPKRVVYVPNKLVSFVM